MSTRPPRISIGLPVFNGERYLDQTLQSILAQDYGDFEVIVSDNASTDETVEIVERWAKKDSRIKLFRNSENLGGAANFNKVLELAEGDLFRWAGHDDLMAPGMLRRCIDTFEAEGPDCVLVFPQTIEIDAEGREISLVGTHLDLTQTSPVERYYRVARFVGKANVLFGLMRTRALRSTRGLGTFPSADLVLIGELALRGRFRQVDEPLFFRRAHPDASWHATGHYEGFAEWFDPRQRKKLVFPSWRLLREFTWAPWLSDLPLGERARASVVGGFTWLRRKRLQLFGDIRRVPSALRTTRRRKKQ
jgi:glycosyltransferase involved in cell wall biosynthesis